MDDSGQSMEILNLGVQANVGHPST